MNASSERITYTVNWNFDSDVTAQSARVDETRTTLQPMSLREELNEIVRVLQSPATIVGCMMLGVSAIYEFAPDVVHRVFMAITLHPTASKLIALANVAIAALAFIVIRSGPGKAVGWIAFAAIITSIFVISQWALLGQ